MLRLYNEGIRRFAVGTMPGFDRIAATTVLKLKQIHSDIHLILIEWQTDTDRNENTPGQRYLLTQLRERADRIEKSSKYDKADSRESDMVKALAEDGGRCLCYLIKETGDTRRLVEYVQERGIPIQNIAN